MTGYAWELCETERELEACIKHTNRGYINTVHEYEYAYPLTCQYVAPPIQAKLNSTVESSCYPFCSNTVKVENKPVKRSETTVKELFTTKVIPAMNSKYAPSWLCKPYVVYIIDGMDYLEHELEAQLQGQTCELPAAANERKLAANLPPRLQQPARKDRVSKAREPQPIVNVSKELPKAKLTFKSQEEYSPYFINVHHSKFTKTLGATELQAARNLEDAISATKQGLKNVISFAKGFYKAQVERALKAAA